MNHFSMSDSLHRRCLIAAVIALACSSCGAMSRMGTAEVTEADGQPCFALPLESQTRGGLPLSVLYVSEIRSPDNGVSLPGELWHIASANLGSPVQLRPQACIRYGQAPSGTVQRSYKPLELFHPYHVAIRAPGARTVAYTADFCLKPDATGKVKVVVVPLDGNSEEKRFSICTKNG